MPCKSHYYLKSFLHSVVVLKGFVRSYVEYSNAPSGYAYKKALERFEKMVKVDETRKTNAVADSGKEKTTNNSIDTY